MGLRIGAAVLVILLAVVAWGYWPPRLLPDDSQVDRIVVHKAARKMELLHDDDVIARYRIALGAHPVGPKQALGDGRTPEGDYVIDYHNPTSQFHRSLHISYPSPNDASKALERGYEPGGMIMIHGVSDRLERLGRFHTFMNWTDGCIAVTNAEIEQIFRRVEDGTPIRIEP
jgi:murein L,D-transpeptidase YafK